MRNVDSKKPGLARLLIGFVACGAFVSLGAVATSPAGTAVTLPRIAAPLPCKATLAQMASEALFSGIAGERKLVPLLRSPGERLLPATGGATPPAAVIGQFDAKTAEGQCAFETTAYVGAPLGGLLGLMSLGPEGKAFHKKLESLSPAQKQAVINSWLTGDISKLAVLLGLAPGGQLPGGGQASGLGAYRDLRVKVVKLTSATAIMTISGLEAGTQTIGGRSSTIWLPFSEPGIQASKIDGRWFLSGTSGANLST
ncbi:MAG: hypothetical protein ACP5VR_10465 [Acidimicrobiales bacterium]